MTETIISLETAKLAKEKGFNEHTDEAFFERIAHTWEDPRDGDLIEFEYLPPRVLPVAYADEYNVEVCKAPSQSVLQKWLRDVHRINIGITFHQSNGSEISYDFCVFYPYGSQSKVTEWSQLNYNTYEKALEAGLLSALKLIKQ